MKRVLLMAAFVGPLAAGCKGVEYPTCEGDDDCKEGEYCVNSLCQQCRSDGDCESGQICEAGACTAAACAYSSIRYFAP